MGYVDHAADGIAILLWAASPEQPELLHTPFFFAAAAAAMDVPVEIYCTAGSVRLLVPGVAEALQAPMHQKNIASAMREAVALGTRILACTDALRAHAIDPHGLIPECTGHGGAVQFMARAANLRWRTLVF
jgi:predicted peroxiredoxin